MFSTFDLTSFDQISKVKTVRPGKSLRDKVQSTRSKTGCSICRQRKKKCDETHPVCIYCQKRGLKCEWGYKNFNLTSIKRKLHPVAKVGQNDKTGIKLPVELPLPQRKVPQLELLDDVNVLNENQAEEDQHSIELGDILNHDSTELQLIKPSRGAGITVNIPNLSELPGGANLPNSAFKNLNHISSIDDFLTTDFNDILNLPLYSTPTSTFNLYLDETGIKYLDYFETKVAQLLSISPHSSNYFLKTFFTIAVTNECLLNCLAAWGALFHKDADTNVVNQYLQKAKSLVRHPQQKYDYLITLAYYLITLGIQICSGDVKNWYVYFNKSSELLQKYGGVLKFLKDFDYSNDAKFLIANFQIHDIMSSTTLSKGTICSMNSYNDIFKINKILELDNYGIDPYQGCMQPIFLLLGEIMNINVELRQEWKLIFDQLENMMDVNIQRINIFKKVDEKYYELLNKINFCKPIESQLNLLTPDGIYNHLKLFELHRLTCKIYLLLYIKQTQPISSEIQYLLLSCFDLLEELSHSMLVSSLNMPLLICGICSCFKYDRMKLDKIIETVYSRYEVGNVKRIWDVIKESWRRNPNGNICVDWIDICDDFGWKLSVC